MAAELYDPPISELDRLRAEAVEELMYLFEFYAARDRSRAVKPTNPEETWLSAQIDSQSSRYVTVQAKYTMACVDKRLSEVLDGRP